MPELKVSAETLNRMKKIVGKSQIHDGDYLVNEMIDIFEKKINDLR